MPEPITDIELTVLGWVGNDYEALHTIDTRISEDLRRDVPRSEIHATLLALRSRGLVNAYVHDESTSGYRDCLPEAQTSIESLWWMATPAGQRLLGLEPEGP